MKYLTLLLFSLITIISHAAEYEGFTEPKQEIKVAAAELGIIQKIAVKEGDKVKKGQLLAALDTQVLEASLAVAKAKMNAQGRLKSAQAIEKLRKDKLNRLLPLLAQGNAQQYEVTQAQIELEAATAEVGASKDNLSISTLEYKQIQAQIAHRQINSPINGVVIDIVKEVAEIVGGNDFHIMTIAALDQLIVNIHVPTAQALSLKEKQEVTITFPNVNLEPVQAKISTIAPITDASSDTVKVKINLDNSKGKLRSGVKCSVRMTE